MEQHKGKKLGQARKSSLFLTAALILFQPCSILAGQENILLKNARIYTMAEKGILEKGMILIRQGKIEKIGKSIDPPSGAQIIDLAGKTIIPGIVCASASLFLEEKDLAFSGEEKLDTDILEGLNYFDPSIPEVLKHGVTTVYISPVSFQSIGGLGAVVKLKAEKEGSLDILKAKAGLKFRLERMKNKKTSSVLRLTQYNRIRDLFKQAQEYKKEWKEYENKLKEYEEAQNVKSKEKSAAKKPKEPKKPKRDEGKDILLQAMDEKIPVRFEVHRPDTILNALKLAEEFGLKVILEECEEWNGILPQLKDASVCILSNPLLDYEKFMIPGGKKGYAAGLLKVRENSLFYSEAASALRNGSAEKNWTELISSKIPFALIPSDHFPLSARYMRLFASFLVSEGVSHLGVLESITSSPAEILGVSERVGSLEQGKDADMVVLGGEPLNSLSAVEMVFVDGSLAWKRKK